MPDSSRPSRHAWLDTLVFASVAAALAVAATFVMFSMFMLYDDEGYVLLSLRNYTRQGALYRDVYSQYGPFPFVLYDALQATGIPLTHTVGRLLAVVAWTGAALSCAWLVRQVTRSLILPLAVLASVFLYLQIMAREPAHPGGLIVLLTTLSAALGYQWILAGRLARWAVLAGAVAAALLLTKINIGAFFAFSASAWFLLHHGSPAVRRAGRWTVGAWAVVLPLALMRPLLGTPWVQTYAFLFAGAGVTSVLALAGRETSGARWRALGTGLAVAAIVAAAVIGAVMLRGTRPADLLEGMLLGPLRQPTAFSLRYLWPSGINVVGIVSIAACAAACWARARQVPGIDTTVALLRLLLAFGLAVVIARSRWLSPDYAVFGWAFPCLWLFVWPLGAEAPARTGARAWVALLLLGQCLHPFPVPGSQLAWGSVLAIPLAAIGAWEAGLWLGSRNLFSVTAGTALRRAVPWGLAAFATIPAWIFAEMAYRYRDGQNLRVPGAELLRLPDRASAVVRLLVHNATAHADVLFSLPGMFSFNIWSDLPTPTHANVTHWFSLLGTAQQQAIIDQLAAHPRACIIVHRDHINFLATRGLAPKGLLYDYIMAAWDVAFAVDGFEFRVHRGRKVEPFLVADLLSRAPDAGASRTEDSLLTFALLLPPALPISSITLEAENEEVTPVILNAGTARVEVGPANRQGALAGPMVRTPWPVTVSRPSILHVYFNRGSSPTATSGTIVLRNTAGDEVGLARLRP